MSFFGRMFKGLTDWFDNRTGYRKFLHEALYEDIPGGARWIYVTGSMLVFAFVTQVITGIFLWMCYSPSSHTAWESVHYIQNEMVGGWLLRGVHHFMAQAMIVLLPLHMLQVILCKAYKAPREVNYWLGLILMLLVLGLGLTGYLLPWDQKGYWATNVATNLASLAPAGPYAQKLVVGGSDYGHHTLTRFFALHAGLLPALLVLVLGLHVALFRKHGITPVGADKRPAQYFWPHQVFKDALACLILLFAVIIVTVGVTNIPKLFTGNLPPTSELGAELGAPADPSEEFAAARPEWYFLFLFQLLKKFKSEFIGAIVVPTLVIVYLFAMPLVAKIRFGHVVNVVVLFLLLLGAGYLTFEAWYHDNYSQLVSEKPTDDAGKERYESSERYVEAVEQAEAEYNRIQELIDYYGIETRAIDLVRNDPEIMGPRLFRRYCASCHSYLDENGHGIAGPVPSADGKPNGAANLYGFAREKWFKGIFSTDPKTGFNSPDFFGLTAHKNGEMLTEVVQAYFDDLDEDGKKQLDAMIAALVYEAEFPDRKEADAKLLADNTIETGREMVANSCTECHQFHDDGAIEDNGYTDLTGYGSPEWLGGFIRNPAHERFYGETGNDRMPAFGESILSEHQIDMLVRWIRGDDRDLERKLQQQRAAAAAAKAKPAEGKIDDEDE